MGNKRYTIANLRSDAKFHNDTLKSENINQNYTIGGAYGYVEIRLSSGALLDAGNAKDCFIAMCKHTDRLLDEHYANKEKLQPKLIVNTNGHIVETSEDAYSKFQENCKKCLEWGYKLASIARHQGYTSTRFELSKDDFVSMMLFD